MIPSLILSLKLPGRDCFDSLWVSTRDSEIITVKLISRIKLRMPDKCVEHQFDTLVKSLTAFLLCGLKSNFGQKDAKDYIAR